MCDPVSIGLTMGAISALQFHGERQTAKAQSKALEQSAQAEANQMATARDEEIGTRTRQARIEAARRAVAAGEGGVVGQSVDTFINDPFSQASQANAMTALQGRMNDEALQGRFQAQKSSIKRPSALEGGLQIAGGAMSGYASGLSIQNARASAEAAKAARTIPGGD